MNDGGVNDMSAESVAVMLIALQDSPSSAGNGGSHTGRLIMERGEDLIFPVVARRGGTFVKTTGVSALCLFKDPQAALPAAIDIQEGVDRFNVDSEAPVPIFARVGIHYGEAGIGETGGSSAVENIAELAFSSASAGEIYITGNMRDALAGQSGVLLRFARAASLPEENKQVSLYKAYWRHAEADAADRKETAPHGRGLHALAKMSLLLLAPLLGVFMFIGISGYLNGQIDYVEKREIRHVAD